MAQRNGPNPALSTKCWIEAYKRPKESLEVHVGGPTAFSVRGIRTSFSCIKDSRMITYVRRTLTVFGGMIGGMTAAVNKF